MNRLKTRKGTYPRESGNKVFNPLLLIKRDRPECFPAELTRYYYKNYDIGFSIETSHGYPHRVLSIAPHGFCPGPMDGYELTGLLEHFGFYSFLPVGSYCTPHPDDPYTGDTQHYRQMIMDLHDLQDLPAAAGQ